MSGAKAASAAWRQAGVSYLQYLGISSKAVRSALKVRSPPFHATTCERRRVARLTSLRLSSPLIQEPAKSRAMSRETMFYNKALGQGEKTAVTSNIPK